MVWTATSIVAADVTDRPASVVAHQDVVNELESGPAVTTPSPSPAKTNGPAPTAPGPGRAPVIPSSPNAPLPPAAPSRTPQAGVTVAPASPPTTSPAPAAAPTPRPTTPPTTRAASRTTATYSTSGGVVRVACNGFFINLISAIPANGYSADVVSAGPGTVDVRFVRSGQELSVKAFCYGEPIRYYEQSPPRQGPGTP